MVCCTCRAVAEQLLAVLCSLSNLLAEQDQPLLGELHAGTIDLLLGEAFTYNTMNLFDTGTCVCLLQQQSGPHLVSFNKCLCSAQASAAIKHTTYNLPRE